MKVYVLTFEPYHENSTVLGAWTEFDTAMNALFEAPENFYPGPDNTDYYLLQEFEGTQLKDSWRNEYGRLEDREPGWKVERCSKP